MGLEGATGGYRGLQGVTGSARRLQGVTGDSKGLQGFLRLTGDYNGVTKDFRIFFLSRTFTIYFHDILYGS